MSTQRIKQTLSALLLFWSVISASSFALRVGDPGVTFDSSKYDSDYPEMREWQKAGVEGGIPWLSNTPIKKTIGPTNSDGLNAAINEVSNSGGGQLRLRNGTYNINKKVNMKKNVRIVGESRNGVKLNIIMRGTSGYAIEFNVHNAAIENLTIQGGHGTPNDFSMTDAKPDFLISSVNFGSSSKNCWLDKVNILNSGNSAISSWNAKHITIRDVYIERSWNKGGGGHGYVALQGSYMLMTGSVVKKMRHISIQKQHARYNVIYDNNFEQEVSFHVGDAGYNLVENNTITLPSGLGKGWHAIMTPWSYKHAGPGPHNAVYKNNCRENNNGGITSFSDPNIVYVPEAHYQVFTESRNTPSGGTFYPIILGGNSSSSSSSSSSTGGNQSPYQHHTIPGLIQLEDFDEGSQGIAYHDTSTGNSGNEYRTNENVDIQSTSDTHGGYNLGWLANGEWLEYTIASISSGTYDISLRIAANGRTSGKGLKIKLAGRTLGTLNFSGTGGWQQWQTIQLKNVPISGGNKQLLRLEIEGGNFNINWLQFDLSTGSNPAFSVEAESFVSTGGAYGGFQTYSTASGTTAINFNQRGDWADYTVDVPETGNYLFEAWLGTIETNSAIEVLVNGVPQLKETVPNNGNWDNFEKLSSRNTIPLNAGQQTIRIQSSGITNSTWEWNADRFSFSKQ